MSTVKCIKHFNSLVCSACLPSGGHIHTLGNDVISNPYCSREFSYPRTLLPHFIVSIITAIYRPTMQANSAILEGLFVVQLCTIVGSSGTRTGDHKTSTMPTNPRILLEKKIKIIEERNKSKKVKVKVHSAKIKRNETSVQKEKMENLGQF